MSKIYVKRSFLGSVILMALLAASARADQKPNGLADPFATGKCSVRDPLCSSISPSEPPTEKPAHVQVSSKSPPKRNIPMLTHPKAQVVRPASQGPVPHPAPASSHHEDTGVTTTQVPSGEWKYVFDGDLVNGSGIAPGDEIRARHRISAPLRCFDPYWAVFEAYETAPERWNDLSALKQAFSQMKICEDPCISEEDATFLANCMDWSNIRNAASTATPDELPEANSGLFACSPARIKEGLASGDYGGSGSITDLSGNATCKPDHGLLVRRLALHAREEFAHSHACPQNLEGIEQLKTLSDRALQQGYDLTRLPDAGKPLLGCGYNESHRAWFPATHERFPDRTTFVTDYGLTDQGMDCNAFVSDSMRPGVFWLARPDCSGRSSYRHGGEIGDVRLVPLVDKVWLKVVYDSSRVFYYGFLFEN